MRFLVVLSGLAALATVRAADAPNDWVEAGFSFDWTTAGTPIPVVEQCDTLNIKWDRGNQVGSNPSAPYSLQIYTSTFVIPLTVDAGSGQQFDFPVPFVPDTQFQICMFDKEGVPGGCQRIMTVIPNSANGTPTCRNLTYPRPEQQLQVDAKDVTGPLSQFGWPAQCTDLSITPTSGTPPYTLTVAPALHPPYNFTGNATNSPINWTISLNWASPFFISLVDKDGNAWSNGPLHSGRGESNLCLSSKQVEEDNSSGVSTAVVAGASVASAIGGLLLGLIGAFFLYRRRNESKRRRRPSDDPLLHDPPSPKPSPSLIGGPASRYHVEPFIPSEQGGTGASEGGLSSPPQTAALSDGSGSSNNRPGGHVYVVHHDGGRAPVTVYTADGTEVVELPPRYAGENNSSGGTTTAAIAAAPPGRAASSRVTGPRQRMQVHEQRRPGTAQKPREVRLEPPSPPPRSGDPDGVGRQAGQP